jgi:hypothetical protein
MDPVVVVHAAGPARPLNAGVHHGVYLLDAASMAVAVAQSTECRGPGRPGTAE